MSLNISQAIESNNIQQIRDAIGGKFKFTSKNSPLGLAASLGNLEIVEILVNAGCKVEWGGNLEPSPLFLAAQAGHSSVVKFLIDNGAKLDYKDEDGFTPLMTAAAIGNLEAVKLLVEAGAKLNIESEHGDFALLSAISNGHTKIYEYLLPLTSSKLEKKIRNFTYQSDSISLDEKPSKEFNSLIDAIAEVAFTNAPSNYPDIDRVSKLIDLYTNPQSVDIHGQTALHHAIFSAEITNILLERGFISVLDNQTKEGNTPLIEACLNNHDRVVEILLNAGASTEIKNHQGDTPLICTVKVSRSSRIIQLLYNAGANLETQDIFGNTGIVIAYAQSKLQDFYEESQNNINLLKSLGASTERFKEIDFIDNAGTGKTEPIIEFLENGGNINCRGSGGTSALAVAIEANQLDILRILLDRGASLNNVAYAFVSAVYMGNVEVVQELIGAGVDVNEPDPRIGIFALTRAVEKNNIAMVEILLKSGAKVPKRDPVFGNVTKMAKIVNTKIYQLIINGEN